MQRNTPVPLSLSMRLAAALAASLVTFTLSARTPSERPGLVVGITIEGLSEDYIDLLCDYFGKEGFQRLTDSGVVVSDLEYGPGIDATAATAMLVTGAPASISGVQSGSVFDTATLRSRPVLLDPSTIGNFTTETYSPEALCVSTLSDELRVAGGGIGRSYAIAPEPQQAILLAGHAGNAAFWINDVNGNWSTTTFYKDVPGALSQRNFTNPLATRLDTLRWAPVMEPARYPGIPKYKKAYPFRHVFQRNDPDRYRAFKASATANTEVTDLAIDFITTMALGKEQETDMVSVAYTLAPYSWSKDPDSRLETLDAYLRLDSDLARLFRAIDTKGPGMARTLVWVAGVPAPPSGKRDDERFRIPYGQFSPRKAVSLLNMYLMALHGNGEWVSGYHDNQIFLNGTLIKERNLDRSELRRETADFLTRMSGVAEAWTIDDITSRRAGAQSEAMLRNTALSTAGDVRLTIAPGWEIADDAGSRNSLKQRPQVSRLATQTYPAYILAPGLKPERILVPVDACVLAPSVSRLLRIRSPNGAASAPLRLD